MRKHKIKRSQQVKHALVSLFVLFVFFVPFYATLNWLQVVVFGNDPRKTVEIENAKATTFDKLKPFKEPYISITFDDGWESIYSEGFPILEEYGIKTTQYVLGDEFNNYLYMSEAQIRSMQKAGHEIASHTMSHPNLTELDNKDLIFELTQSKTLLEAKFGSIKDFATPLGAYDDDVLKQVQQNYRSHRNTNADPETVDELDVNIKDYFDQYNIIAYTIRRTTTKEDLQKLISYTKKQNGWLVLTYHQVDSTDAAFGVTPEVLREQMMLVRDSGMRTPPIGAVLDAYKVQTGSF